MKHTYTIYIVRPEDGALVTVEYWKREENPQRAEFVEIARGDGTGFVLAKEPVRVDGEISFDWEEAVEHVKAFKPATRTPATKFRLPDRLECLDIYDARFQGLDEALELIGGTPVYKGDARWIWTADEDPDPEYAFVFNGYGGSVLVNLKCYTSTVRPVATITL